MTTYKEYLTTHPHIQMDERILDRNITSDALMALELYNHLDRDVKDYYQYEDKMNAVVDYYDDNNVSIIASTTGGTTPIDVSCVLGDKNRITFDYVEIQMRDSASNTHRPELTMGEFIAEVNEWVSATAAADRTRGMYERPSTDYTLMSIDDDTHTRFDYVVFAERARRLLERKIENAGLSVDRGYTNVDLYHQVETSVYTKMPDGKTESLYEVTYDPADKTVDVRRKDIADYRSENENGAVHYSKISERILGIMQSDNLDACLTYVDDLAVIKQTSADELLSSTTNTLAQFNPLDEIPHAGEVFGSKFARTTVSETIIDGTLNSAYADYTWMDEQACPIASAHFTLPDSAFVLPDTTKEWTFNGEFTIVGEGVERELRGTLAEAKQAFEDFKTELNTKVNAVYASNIVEELNDDNLEL